MLKLRKNKKGFTLVELIVVIAIMAVLAGVVAGVTVSQLNKNTDKTNLSQAKGIADFVAGEIADTTSSVYSPTTGELVDTQIITAIKDQYKSVTFSNTTSDSTVQTAVTAAPGKGIFAINIVKTTGNNPKVESVEILYTEKQSGGKTKGYKVSDDGVIEPINEWTAPRPSGDTPVSGKVTQ